MMLLQAGLDASDSGTKLYREAYPALSALAKSSGGRMAYSPFMMLLSGVDKKKDILAQLVSDSIVVEGGDDIGFEWQASLWYARQFLPPPTGTT